MLIQIIFSNKMSPVLKKHRLLIRKIISKLIKKFGSGYVTKLMPEYHKKMIAYLEKEKRKKANKKQKEHLLVLMGEKNDDTVVKEEDSSDESSDDENVLKPTKTEVDSEDEQSDDENEVAYHGGSG